MEKLEIILCSKELSIRIIKEKKILILKFPKNEWTTSFSIITGKLFY